MEVDVLDNGHVAGRTAPPLPTFTFRDGGRTVAIRKLSPMTAQEIDRAIRRQHPSPEPPIVETPGPDGRPERTENRADPDYIAALEAWQFAHNQRTGTAFLRLIALRSVVCEVDREELAQFFEDMASIGVPITRDPDLAPEQADKLIYVQHILVGSPDDLRDLQAFVTQRSQPTEEAVMAYRASFRDDVSE